MHCPVSTPARVLLALSMTALANAALAAQEPAATQFWAVTSTPLTLPPALARGLAGAFWNPAQVRSHRRELSVSLDIIETAPEIGLTSVLIGARSDLGSLGTLILGFSHVGVGDLLRTSTNPTVEGAIDVFAQSVGMGWSRGFGRFESGVAVRVQSVRLDDRATTGVTADIGLRYALADRLHLAAATQFFDPVGTEFRTVLFTGADAQVWRGSVAGVPISATLRFGTSSTHLEGTDLIFGLGLGMAGRVDLDVALADEGSLGGGARRGKIGVAARIGRYRVHVARAEGVADLGSVVRIGFEAAVR